MAQQKIYLSKIRDFGENIGDTFQFIRQEFKPLVKSFLLIAGAFILGAAVLRGIYQMQIGSVLTGIGRRPGDFSFFSQIFTGTYFLILLLVVLGMVAMKISIAAYMKLYEQTNTSPSVEEVWREFRKYFFPAFFLTLIIWVLVIIGLAFCILPGIYLAVVFTPAVVIMVNEDATIGQAFSRCFELVKENFWMSLGIYFVSILIYYVASSIIGVVIGLVTGVASYLTTHQINSTFSAVTSVASIFGYIFYIIYFVSVCFNYYSLAEKIDGFGMMKRLDDLGSVNPNNTIEEQY